MTRLEEQNQSYNDNDKSETNIDTSTSTKIHMEKNSENSTTDLATHDNNLVIQNNLGHL